MIKKKPKQNKGAIKKESSIYFSFLVSFFKNTLNFLLVISGNLPGKRNLLYIKHHGNRFFFSYFHQLLFSCLGDTLQSLTANL